MRQTIVGVFDQYEAARRAAQALESNGLPADHVHVTTSEDLDADDDIVRRDTVSRSDTHDDDGVLGHIRHFFADLFGSDDSPDMAHYAEAVRRGGAVVKVDIDDGDDASEVSSLLESAGAVDIDKQVESWRAEGWEEPERLSATQSAGRYGEPLTPSREAVGSSDAARRSGEEESVLPVVQENLEIGKRAISKGGVRVYSRTVERPVEEEVQLREEHADVQRRPVDRPATEADLADLTDRTIEVREMEERPVVQKTARVVEEVAVGKRVQQRTERVKDTVRSTEVKVERVGEAEQQQATSRKGVASGYASDDDSAFRSHFASTYQSAGGRYEDYAPHYAYGRQLRSEARYKGRKWDDIESDVRSDWEARNPGSSWERFKAAVRSAWDNMTS